ncbi:hypothetical protein BGX16_2146 [Hallerella succinigenes]|uniref:Uncharacterized protein n=1 Tax=Hallerella succinigenes TaxID=1896222 RepID=A0A2M9A8T3_9BACT|nr:hypothetical protein BGX16_2146 [Hallerella succinigenes]
MDGIAPQIALLRQMYIGLDKKSRKAFLGCHIACPDCKSETVDFRRISMLFEGVFPLFQNKIYIHARCQQP